MHYTGTIWRPPYEAESLLLEVTAGCTHHKCSFCTLYNIKKQMHTAFQLYASVSDYIARYFQWFRFGTTASICARTCSGGQLSLDICSTQKSISCSTLVYLNSPSV